MHRLPTIQDYQTQSKYTGNHVHLDLIVPPHVNGFKYCLPQIDRRSRWPVAVPLTNIKADTVAFAFYDCWTGHYGPPLKITMDQGMQLESTLFSALAKLTGCKIIPSTPYTYKATALYNAGTAALGQHSCETRISL